MKLGLPLGCWGSAQPAGQAELLTSVLVSGSPDALPTAAELVM